LEGRETLGCKIGNPTNTEAKPELEMQTNLPRP